MRKIVIDETVEPAVAIPFSNPALALSRCKELLLAFVAPDLDFEPGDEEYDQIANATDEEALSSCDTCGPLPLPDEDFIGNGDPHFYLTAGQPDGEPVTAIESCTRDDVHTIYAAWLAEHGSDGCGGGG